MNDRVLPIVEYIRDTTTITKDILDLQLNVKKKPQWVDIYSIISLIDDLEGGDFADEPLGWYGGKDNYLKCGFIENVLPRISHQLKTDYDKAENKTIIPQGDSKYKQQCGKNGDKATLYYRYRDFLQRIIDEEGSLESLGIIKLDKKSKM